MSSAAHTRRITLACENMKDLPLFFIRSVVHVSPRAGRMLPEQGFEIQLVMPRARKSGM
jgi:hypothetical protein